MDHIEDMLRAAAAELGITLYDTEITKFNSYYRELMFWNRKMSLVAVKTPSDVPVKHFADSLTVIPYLPKGNTNLLDIGSGAGFPGIPLKIVQPPLMVTLVDSSRKKCSFLRHVILTLALETISVVHTRIEHLPQERPYTFDTVISRASFKLSRLIEHAAPLLAPGGILIAMKGAHIDDELNEAKHVLSGTAMHPAGCHHIRLPLIGDERHIVLFRKSGDE